MSESVKVTYLEAENFKRVKSVSREIPAVGLTLIGGRNLQGKTSILDAIAYALGGEDYRPSNLKRDGTPENEYPELRVTLSNGVTVERKGKNSALKVTDPSGNRAGQTLLDSFVEELAINLPKFMEQRSKEKASTLLKILGIGEQLAKMEAEEKRIFDERTLVGREADRKEKHALELQFFDGVPASPLSAAGIIENQKAILSKNAENDRIRREAADYERQMQQAAVAVQNASARLADLERQISEARAELERRQKAVSELFAKITRANEAASILQDGSTAELERQLKEIEETNAKIRSNQAKETASNEAKEHREKYNLLTADLEAARARRMALLNGANMPLPGLSVSGGELTLNGKAWDCMSGSEQLRASCAIVRALNPRCGFVLVDRLEAMDKETLGEFGSWLERENLQAIGTIVSTGNECSFLIEDGQIAPPRPAPRPAPRAAQ
jgi:hypothetical protein